MISKEFGGRPTAGGVLTFVLRIYSETLRLRLKQGTFTLSCGKMSFPQ